jgi:peroxiredoxin Q/BCP
MALSTGDTIPAILGTDHDGKEVTAHEFEGQKLVIYFYPKDSTPGCTAEACSFRDTFPELRKAGYSILGVSVDSEKSHQRFREKQNLPFPLISDSNHRLVELFGVWAEKTLAGRKYMGTMRTTFLIDSHGVIRHIFDAKQIDTKTHAQQILQWAEQNQID